ncbi:hypothetical protein BJV77DRAFT_961521 [Russula vinacea]|nr:hypothetical protein BJV77DRAFT_961521 [Russula vinacea]
MCMKGGWAVVAFGAGSKPQFYISGQAVLFARIHRGLNVKIIVTEQKSSVGCTVGTSQGQTCSGTDIPKAHQISMYRLRLLAILNEDAKEDPGSSCFVVGSVIGSIPTTVLATQVLVNSRVMASREPSINMGIAPPSKGLLPPGTIPTILWPNNKVSGSTLATLKQVTNASQKANLNGPVPISEGDARESTSPNGICSSEVTPQHRIIIAVRVPVTQRGNSASEGVSWGADTIRRLEAAPNANGQRQMRREL